jgi:hypothetical protein
MVTMQLKRYPPIRRRSRLPFIIFGCVATVLLCGGGSILVGFLLTNVLPSIAMQAAGFQATGRTDDVFAAATEFAPEFFVQSTLDPNQVILDVGQFGQRTLNTETSTIQIEIGSSTAVEGGMADMGGSGGAAPATEVRLIFDAADLLDLCFQYSVICAAESTPIRNVRFILRNGGIIAQGEFYVEQAGIWQTVGVVMRQSGVNQLTLAGVDLNGTLYTTPSGELTALIDNATDTANEVLRQLTVQASGQQYTLSAMYFESNAITVIMR